MLRVLVTLSAGLTILVAISGDGKSEERELTFHSGDEFSKEFERQLARGFRPIDMAMYTEKQVSQMAVIWAKRQQPEFAVQTGLPVDQFEEKTNEYRDRGFRMVRVAADRAGTGFHFSGIWEKREEPVHVRVGFAAAKFETDQRQLIGEGCCPLHLTITSVNGMEYYSCVWDVAGEPKRELERGLTQTEVTRAITKRTRDGFRILQVCGYAVGATDRYAGVWEKSKGKEREVTVRQTATGLTRAIKRMQSKGLQPDRISVYPAGGQTRFAVVWEAE